MNFTSVSFKGTQRCYLKLYHCSIRFQSINFDDIQCVLVFPSS